MAAASVSEWGLAGARFGLIGVVGGTASMQGGRVPSGLSVGMFGWLCCVQSHLHLLSLGFHEAPLTLTPGTTFISGRQSSFMNG